MSLFVHKDANGTLTVGKDGKVLHFTEREALQLYTWLAHHCHAPAKPLDSRDRFGCEDGPEEPTRWCGSTNLRRVRDL
jgi:hypothetical protein